MINCQERVACQLASDLCALCPNHLLRGERSCLSYYNGLYTHLCHGKGELPWRGLLLSVARLCSCFAPVCHLCVACRYHLKETMLSLWLCPPTSPQPYTVGAQWTTLQGKFKEFYISGSGILYLHTKWINTVYTLQQCKTSTEIFRLSVT